MLEHSAQDRQKMRSSAAKDKLTKIKVKSI